MPYLFCLIQVKLKNAKTKLNSNCIRLFHNFKQNLDHKDIVAVKRPHTVYFAYSFSFMPESVIIMATEG